jgi:hypothetical protein
MQANALSLRETALKDSQAKLQAELDQLLAKQEERLRAWEAGCLEAEQQLQQRTQGLQQQQDR